jgi:hypothetical protein
MLRSILMAGVLALLAGKLVAAEPEGKPEKSPLLADGMLQQVKPSIRQMLTFTFNGPKLAIDSKAWGAAPKDDKKPPPPFGFREDLHPIDILFNQVQNQAAIHSAGSSGGGGERSRRFNGTKLNGSLRTRDQALLLLHFEEAGEGGRAIEFADDGKGAFRLQVTHSEGDMILLIQTPKGGFRGVAMLGKRTFAGQGDSFTDFYKQHRATMEADILPILGHFGIEPVLSPFDPGIKKNVIALLQRSPDSLDKGKKLLADLDNDQFTVREQASKALTDGFAVYRDLVLEQHKDPANSLEVKTRLEKIVNANADAARVSHLVALLELEKDAAYLTALLDGASSADAAAIAAHLEKLTGQKFGTDAKAWKAWLEKQKKSK